MDLLLFNPTVRMTDWQKRHAAQCACPEPIFPVVANARLAALRRRRIEQKYFPMDGIMGRN